MSRNKGAQSSRQSVQVIAGDYRHRKIDVVSVEDLRPTGARVRETLFNWLQYDIVGAQCLDLFAGSGILGFEALSRGAKTVTFVEKNRHAAQQLRENARTLGCNNALVCHHDYTVTSVQHYDVVFLDPPYRLALLPDFVEFASRFTPKFIFIEDERPFDTWVDGLSCYQLHKSKKAGGVYYGLLKAQNEPC